jgi:hypothetical protein
MVIVTCLDTVKAEHLNSEETEFGVHTTLGVLVLCIGAFQVKEGVANLVELLFLILFFMLSQF